MYVQDYNILVLFFFFFYHFFRKCLLGNANHQLLGRSENTLNSSMLYLLMMNG